MHGTAKTERKDYLPGMGMSCQRDEALRMTNVEVDTTSTVGASNFERKGPGAGVSREEMEPRKG
jgi:hypothetical protein